MKFSSSPSKVSPTSWVLPVQHFWAALSFGSDSTKSAKANLGKIVFLLPNLASRFSLRRHPGNRYL